MEVLRFKCAIAQEAVRLDKIKVTRTTQAFGFWLPQFANIKNGIPGQQEGKFRKKFYYRIIGKKNKTELLYRRSGSQKMGCNLLVSLGLSQIGTGPSDDQETVTQYS